MKKRKMKLERKLMAFFLALVMVIGIMPGISLTTYADDDPLPSHVHDDINFTAWTSTDSLPSEAGNYYLTDNVTISQPWKVNSEINLCLNGFGIQKIGDEDDTANSHNYGGVIVVETGGNLNICDCNNERTHYITLTNWRGTNVSENGSETEIVNGNGIVKISGGFITGGYRRRWDGGAVLVDAGGSRFTMKSGTILGNIAKQGGAIMGKFSGTNILLKDVTVIYNLSTLNGGGVQNYDSNLTVDNCVITNNCCDNTYSGSGSRLGGGGIHFESGSLTISGNTVVDNNTYKGAEDNLYMRSNKKIAVGALTEGANIGVSMQSVGVFTNSLNSDNNYISKFTSDNQNYAVGLNNANQLYLGTKRIVTFNTGGKGTTPESQIVASGSKTTSPSDPVAEGYTFDGWYKEESLSNKWNFDTDVVTGNITLYAKWNKSYTVTFKVVNGTWDDGEGDVATADKTVVLTGSESDVLKLATEQIPAVGNKPNSGYRAGSWDVTPNTETEITADTVYTYTYVAKEASAVTNAPGANTLTYNGQGQELVTAGTATGGTMQYAVGDATTVPTGGWDASIPKKIDAGTYYVWYKVKGDKDHLDSEPACVEAAIAKRNVTLTSAEDSKDYDGKPLTNDNITVTGEGWAEGEGATYNVTGTQTLPGSSDNGFTYTLNNNTKEPNYNISKVINKLTVNDRTEKYEINVEANSDNVTYDGNEHEVSGFKTLEFLCDDVTYTVSGLEASAKGTEVGKYPVKISGTPVVTDADGNDLTKQFTVNTKEGTLTVVEKSVNPKGDIRYSNYSGDGALWTKGSNAGCEFVFKRSVDDELTFGRFTGIDVDSKAVDASNYTAVSGSVVITLKPEYLETLAVGDHLLTANFDDGNSVTVKFTIKEKSEEKKSDTTPDNKKADVTPGNKKTAKNDAPGTGDTVNIQLIFLVMVLSMCDIFALCNLRSILEEKKRRR